MTMIFIGINKTITNKNLSVGFKEIINRNCLPEPASSNDETYIKHNFKFGPSILNKDKYNYNILEWGPSYDEETILNSIKFKIMFDIV